jgi:hypothetical protein
VCSKLLRPPSVVTPVSTMLRTPLLASRRSKSAGWAGGGSQLGRVAQTSAALLMLFSLGGARRGC